MDSDKKDSGGNNLGLIIGVGSVLVIILLLLLFNSSESSISMEMLPNNFGFSLEDAFDIMK
tara:strand:- start:5446 stop:5628 length:183 start_codon:yes stop_codon:yes gene_type:complete